MGRVHGMDLFKLYFVLLVKSHIKSYPCPLQINYFWNLGFLLGIAILLQIITGIFIALHYTSDLNSAYYQIFFLFLFLHLGRALVYGSYFYNPNTWFSGILLSL